MKKAKKTLITLGSVCMLSLAAHGQSIFNQDYEGMTVGDAVNPAFSYSLGTGSTINSVVAEEGGNKFLRAEATFAADAMAWGTYAMDFFGNLDPDITSAVSTTDPASWVISFDIRTQNNSAGNVKLNVKALDANVDATTDAAFGATYSVTNGGWESYSFTLDSMTPDDSPWNSTNLALTNRLQVFFEFSAGKWGGPGSSGNVFELDNFSLQVVPEPSTYALFFGLATLGFIAFRRSRQR